MNRFQIGTTNLSALMIRFAFALSFVATTVNAASAQLYAVDRDSQNLYTVSTSNAALTLVGNTGQSLGSLEYRPSNGFLYGFTLGSGAQLYRINPANANTTLVGGLGGDFVFEGGLVLAPNGTAYATNKNNALAAQLFTIDLDSGATNLIGTISGGDHDINGLAWRSDGMLVGLDRETNSLLAINPASAASSVIAALAPTVGGIGGMAAVGNTGYFSTSGPGGSVPGSNQLYSFNLFTGAHALIGSFAGTIAGTGIGGLALIPEPTAGTLVFTGILGMVGLGRRRAR